MRNAVYTPGFFDGLVTSEENPVLCAAGFVFMGVYYTLLHNFIIFNWKCDFTSAPRTAGVTVSTLYTPSRKAGVVDASPLAVQQDVSRGV